MSPEAPGLQVDSLLLSHWGSPFIGISNCKFQWVDRPRFSGEAGFRGVWHFHPGALLSLFKKFILNLLQYCFPFMFWSFGLQGCGILAP